MKEEADKAEALVKQNEKKIREKEKKAASEKSLESDDDSVS